MANESIRVEIDHNFQAMKEDIQKTAAENSKEADELPEYRMKRQILSTIILKVQEEIVHVNEGRGEFQRIVKDKLKGELRGCTMAT